MSKVLFAEKQGLFCNYFNYHLVTFSYVLVYNIAAP